MFGATETSNEPLEGSPEWFKKWEKAQLAKARKELADAPKNRLGTNQINQRAPGFVNAALARGKWKQSMPFN